MRRQRHFVAARESLGSAAEAFDRLGALAWAEKARAELLAVSVPTTPCVSETTFLSTQERRIAELAAVGTPTRQIATHLSISPRTVDAHLYRVFRKLLITRRSELGPALSRGPHAVGTVPDAVGGEGS